MSLKKLPFIPYGRQSISKNDIRAVIKVLQSDFLTQGPKVDEFERKMAGICKADYGVALNSATSALHLACLASGLGPEDRAWTSPISFVASANCILYCGAIVDFVDIDPKSYNICPLALRKKLEKSAEEKTLPKLLIVVHLCGQSCDMEEIYRLSCEYGFKIIEDASHATGAFYKNEPVGNCRYSDISIFSFHPVKIITSGEGGMALSNKKELIERIKLLRSHGITREERLMDKASDGPWYYQQLGLGYNYRITDIQAALGLNQLKRIKDFVKKRSFLARRYSKLLKDLPLSLPFEDPLSRSSWHLYVIRLHLEKISKTRKEVFNALRDRGIGVNIHYIPIHTQPYYKALGFKEGMFPKAENYYKEALSLPIFPDLKIKEQDRIIRELKNTIS